MEELRVIESYVGKFVTTIVRYNMIHVRYLVFFDQVPFKHKKKRFSSSHYGWTIFWT